MHSLLFPPIPFLSFFLLTTCQIIYWALIKCENYFGLHIPPGLKFTSGTRNLYSSPVFSVDALLL